MVPNVHDDSSSSIVRIALRRGGGVVSSLIGAYGIGLRETRLTATLGYLLAIAPIEFMELFGFKGSPLSVYLETRHDSGRSDIIVETSVGVGLVEAKITADDPAKQASRYPAQWRVLLTQYPATARQRSVQGYRYLNWNDLCSILRRLATGRDIRCSFVATDLLQHLEEHGMVSTNESTQVYAREINNRETLSAFLHSRLYFCDYERGARLPRMTYFAPHFGQSIANQHPGIRCGISYIAKINKVELVEDWNDVATSLHRLYGRKWKRYIEPIKSLEGHLKWGVDHKRTLLVLGEPRLVFNPAIPKSRLQDGRGYLSKRFFSFDELFEAWSV